MQPFEANVLDKRRTLTEKLVSIFRYSLADQYIPQLSSKIRHFYDLHYLLQDKECQSYLISSAFPEDFKSLFSNDRDSFDKPEGWRDKRFSDAPILTDLQRIWSVLQETYLNELPELAYRTVPEPTQIQQSLQALLDIIRPIQPQI